MKRLNFVAILAGLLITTNGCGILKNKHLEKTISEQKVDKDIAVSKYEYDTTNSNISLSKESGVKTATEEINIKQPTSPENIEISANFRMDTSSALKGDTLKLIDIKNNNVSLSIYQNGKTKELMARVTTNKGSKETPFSEINIKRQYSSQTDKVDSVAAFENHSELKLDSLDKSKIENQNNVVVKDKLKESKPNFWIWAVGIIGAFVLIYFLIKRR